MSIIMISNVEKGGQPWQDKTKRLIHLPSKSYIIMQGMLKVIVSWEVKGKAYKDKISDSYLEIKDSKLEWSEILRNNHQYSWLHRSRPLIDRIHSVDAWQYREDEYHH